MCVNPNVIVKQQPAADDFENDPEAGPSGLQNESVRINEIENRPIRGYPIDSSDDDTGDEREMASALWRPPPFRYSRIDDDSGDTRDTRYSNQSWRFDQTTINEPPSLSEDVPSARDDQIDDVVDLIDNDVTQSAQIPPVTRSHEVLTAPDLQLDWASDSSSDTEIIYTIRPRTPDASVDNPQPNPLLASNELQAIDLTASDDEETSFTRNTSNESPSMRQRDRVYGEMLPTRRILPQYGSMRSSSYHEDDRNDR